MVQLKRVYEPAARADGRRVLVERLWPRGMRKASLAASGWAKEAAPSTELRRWFGHRPERWEEFRRRYVRELDGHPEAWAPLLEEARGGALTLLFSARDTEHNGAVVLREYLEDRASSRGAGRPGVGRGRGHPGRRRGRGT